MLPSQADIVISSYFEREILPVLTPITLDPAHPLPQLEDGSIHLAVRFRREPDRRARYGMVLVHSMLPRLIRIPSSAGEIVVLLVHLIARHLSDLFCGAAIEECRVVRARRRAVRARA